MVHGWQTIEIDGRRFAVRRHPAPDGTELSVVLPGAPAVRLRPWTLADHLAALDRHAFHDGDSPRIDREGLAAEVLARTSPTPLEPRLAAELAPLALWWALGGDEAPGPLPALRPWTCLARAAALDVCTAPDTGALRIGSYLLVMARAAAGPTLAPEALAGATAAAFLDALVEVNAPGQHLSEGPGSAALARTTLRLCRALGWTPGQVWSVAASELDRLLALLDRLEPPRAEPAPTAPRRGGLAAHPDAVIIEVNGP